MPTRGTTIRLSLNPRTLKFQSTCPRGARPPQPAKTSTATYFNPRAHEGHDLREINRSLILGHFNPRAHEGHDQHNPIANPLTSISIHVPTRGTTISIVGAVACHPISIHVPTRGTTNPKSALFKNIIFQSTCPRGARPDPDPKPTSTTHFNPRAHEGHDADQATIKEPKQFQSTCPRGARPKNSNKCYKIFKFQSTCPRGARPAVLIRAIKADLFQSTCPRGARQSIMEAIDRAEKISIHVPTRGTTYGITAQREPYRFQSTCPRGARRGCKHHCLAGRISIHVPTRGTTYTALQGLSQMNFNPRAHEGHDNLPS